MTNVSNMLTFAETNGGPMLFELTPAEAAALFAAAEHVLNSDPALRHVGLDGRRRIVLVTAAEKLRSKVGPLDDDRDMNGTLVKDA